MKEKKQVGMIYIPYIILHKSLARSAKNNGMFSRVSSRFRLSMENLTRRLGEYFLFPYLCVENVWFYTFLISVLCKCTHFRYIAQIYQLYLLYLVCNL